MLIIVQGDHCARGPRSLQCLLKLQGSQLNAANNWSLFALLMPCYWAGDTRGSNSAYSCMGEVTCHRSRRWRSLATARGYMDCLDESVIKVVVNLVPNIRGPSGALHIKVVHMCANHMLEVFTCVPLEHLLRPHCLHCLHCLEPQQSGDSGGSSMGSEDSEPPLWNNGNKQQTLAAGENTPSAVQ